MTELYELREKVALSCRILAMTGLVDEITGHVSVRIPNSNDMLIRCRGEHEEGLPYTEAEAVRRVDFEGSSQDLEGIYDVPLEHPIHGQIYRMRPEVQCVIHAHPPASLMCGITELELKPVFGAYDPSAMQIALEGIPVFPRSILVSNPEIAHSMLEAMGDKRVCLMRGHGITVTGSSIEDATVRAIRVEKLARIIWEISQAGKEPQAISSEDVEAFQNRSGKRGLPRADEWTWRYYVRKLNERNNRS